MTDNITIPRSTAMQALLALWGADQIDTHMKNAIAAITAAMEQQAEPVQEYITHITWDERGVRTVNGIPDDAPQRKPLTDEQIAAIVRVAAKNSAIKRDGSTSQRIARAIEAAHGIKEGT